MAPAGWSSAALALGLAFAGAPAEAAESLESSAATVTPELRGQTWQRSRSSFGIEALGASVQGRMSQVSSPSPTGAPTLLELAQGTLLRRNLSEDASVSLKLRGGRVGLYLAVRFDELR